MQNLENDQSKEVEREEEEKGVPQAPVAPVPEVTHAKKKVDVFKIKNTKAAAPEVTVTYADGPAAEISEAPKEPRIVAKLPHQIVGKKPAAKDKAKKGKKQIIEITEQSSDTPFVSERQPAAEDIKQSSGQVNFYNKAEEGDE